MSYKAYPNDSLLYTTKLSTALWVLQMFSRRNFGTLDIRGLACHINSVMQMIKLRKQEPPQQKFPDPAVTA